jgi:predicted deacylase
MRIGKVEAQAGEHAFGYLEVTKSRSGLSPDIPVHLFVGAKPGPTLLVQSAIHGEEIVGTIAILNFVKKLDPQQMRGTLIAVPVVNRMGFELSERGSRIDGKDISRLFPGNPRGSVSEQVAYAYFEEVIRKADVLLDFHASATHGYSRFVLFAAEKDSEHLSEVERKRRKLVVAFGLDEAVYFEPGTFGANVAKQAIQDAGVVQFTVELGGGAGWVKNGERDVWDAERGIWNTMKAMRMVEGEVEADGPLCTVYSAWALWKPPEVNGLFMPQVKEGQHVKEGEVFASLVDPYTGEELGHIRNTKAGVVIPGRREWPTIGTTTIEMLGVVDRVEDRRTADLTVSFDESES